MTIDGSKLGLGAHLSQNINGKRRVIGYFSKSVQPHKREWAQTKLELLSLFHALEHWRPYLKGTKFKVKTDCIALLNLDTLLAKKDPFLRRKIQAISEFNFEMEHVSGASNTIADFLSRYPFKVTLKDSSTQTTVTGPAESKARRVNKVIKKSLPEQAPPSSNVEPSTQAGIIIAQEIVDRAYPHAEETEICNSSTGEPVHEPARELTNEPVHQQAKIPPNEPPLERDHAASEPLQEQTLDQVTGPEDVRGQGPISEGIDTAEPLPSGTETANQQTPLLEEQGNINPLDFSDQRGIYLTNASQWEEKYTPVLPRIQEEPIEESCICELQVRSIVTDAQDTSADTEELSHNPPITALAGMITKIKEAQEQDHVLKEVIGWLLKQEPPSSIQAHRAPKELISYWKQYNCKFLRLKDGILERRWVSNAKNQPAQEKYLTCIPETMIEEVLKLCHSSLAANHPGIQGTTEVCRRFYYWPGMAKDIELYIEACIICAKSKPPRSFMKAKRKHVRAWKFGDLITIDHIEPEKLGLSSGHFKYILSITDVWSGYVVACATRSQTADDTISKIMHKWVLVHGVPKGIVSDNGPGFASKFYQAVWRSLGCKTDYGLPYECKSTGKAERTNKRLNQGLRVALIDKDPKQWDKYIDYVCSALNALKNRNTSFSANFLRFGHDINTPMSLLLCNPHTDDILEDQELNPHALRAYKQHRAYREILHRVANNLDAAYERDDAAYNSRLDIPFKAGDYCFILTRCPKHKYSPRWHGPIPVLKAINDTVYVVELGGREKVVNISKLKRYKGQGNKFSGLEPTTSVSMPDTTVSGGNRCDIELQPTQHSPGDIQVTVNRPHRRRAPNPTDSSHNDEPDRDLPAVGDVTIPDQPTDRSADISDDSPEVADSGHTGRPQRTRFAPQRLQVVPSHKRY